MREDPIEGIVGFKLAVLVAGLLGGIIQLRLNPGLTLWGAVVSVLAGICSAGYLTPLTHYVYELPPQLEYSIAFVLGLCGMQITAKVYALVGSLSLPDLLSVGREFLRKILSK